MLICDAARNTVELDAGRLKTLRSCGLWRRSVLDMEVLICEEKAKAESVMALLKEKELDTRDCWKGLVCHKIIQDSSSIQLIH